MSKKPKRIIPIPALHPTLTFRLFLVGGIIRDRILGKNSKDIDFTVVASDTTFGVDVTFNAMVAWLAHEHGVDFHVLHPDKGTARGVFPSAGSGHAHGWWAGMDCDFVLARKDGTYSDGRRPDFVEVGTREDDQLRRDFTVNSIAQDVDTGEWFDPHGGMKDLETMTLRFVGDPMDRIREDSVRILRALRFVVTKGFTFATETRAALTSPVTIARLALATAEMRAEELEKMLRHDTVATLDLLDTFPADFRQAMFAGRVRLTSTLKQ